MLRIDVLSLSPLLDEVMFLLCRVVIYLEQYRSMTTVVHPRGLEPLFAA